MSGTKELAGVPDDDCTTAMRLFACCEVRPAANDIDGNIRRNSANTRVIFLTVAEYTAKAALSSGFCLRDAERYCTGPNGGHV